MVDAVSTNFNTNGKTPEEQAAHDEKMAALATANGTVITSRDSRTDENLEVTPNPADPADPPAVTPRPDNVPEKFWNAEKGEVNVEALLKSQQDAEAALRAKAPPTEETPAEGEEPAEGAEKAYDKTVATASTEFSEKGELSDATFESLAKVGLSRDMVNDYIEGQKAIVTNLQTAAFGEFDGSSEKYEAAVKWAQENLTEDELQAIDVQVTSRSPGIIKQGAAALAAKYAAGADITPTTTVTGGGNGANSGAQFNSSAEMQTAMRDPRYKTDPAYRAEVSQKIANADRAGIPLFS